MRITISDLSRRWLSREAAAISASENRVLQSALQRTPISRDTAEEFEVKQDMPGRLADAIARIGGSWAFIVAFLLFLLVWTIGNGWLLTRDAFDPYPFIFLNLVLSMLAAIQAPIIMMSQNRQALRDRVNAAHDYEVNLKSEIEIMALHEKLDEMRHEQIVSMRRTMEEMAERLSRMEARLTEPGKS